MIGEIQKKIGKYSHNIYPHYSLSSKTDNKNIISTNAIIYHAFVLYHLVNIKEAKIEANKCIGSLSKLNQIEVNKNEQKHSIFYKKLHKAALIAQLICSIEGDSNIGLELFKEILDDQIFEIISNSNSFIKKIKSLNLKNSWHDSNIIMSMFCLRFAYCNEDKNDNALNSCINYLKRIQNKNNGLWYSKNDFGGNLNAMAGTYHYLPLFVAMNKRIPRRRKIIDSTIKLHFRKGHFSSPNGHSCIDLDAYSIFYYCNLYERKYSKYHLKYLSEMFLNDLQNIQNKDGGFSDFPSYYKNSELIMIFNSFLKQLINGRCIYTSLWNLKSIMRTSSILKKKLKIISNSDKICSSYIYESNIFSCWFKLLSIDFALFLNNPKSKILENKKYKLPFIGFGL